MARIWFEFFLCAGLIGTAGYQLSRWGDVIAQRTGLGGSWIGLTLVAMVASLPELATGLTSVTLADAPNLAVGNALGSCVLNLAFLVFVDFLYRDEPVWRRMAGGHVLAAAFGVILLGFTLSGILVGHLGSASAHAALARFPVLAIGATTPIVLMLYLIAMRTVFAYERSHGEAQSQPGAAATDASGPSLHTALLRFAFAGAVVVGAGLWLPFIASELAAVMGWNRSFVGSLFLSAVTTLPEAAVTLAALRIGAVDMAIGNLLGSNLFNVTIIALEDLFYRRGPLLAEASLVHTVTAASGIVMTGLAIVGMLFRPRSRVLRTVGWVSVGLAAVYLFNTSVLFLHGD